MVAVLLEGNKHNVLLIAKISHIYDILYNITYLITLVPIVKLQPKALLGFLHIIHL